MKRKPLASDDVIKACGSKALNFEADSDLLVSQIIVLMGLLVYIIGVLPALAGFCATLLLIPISAWTSKSRIDALRN
jgi:hypothetical protein